MRLLVNCIFKEFRHLLRHHVYNIWLIKDLRYPGTEKPLAGLLSSGKHLIYLDKDQCRHEKIKTLIHELSHILFADAPEKEIQKIENLLWEKFNRKQRKYLEKRIPKRVSKIKVTI